MKNSLLFLFIVTSLLSYSQTPCVNGMAGGYPCNQIILQSHLTIAQLHGTNANDIWGWTDSNTGKEYALIGLTDGVTFVDVTIPTSPIAIGKLIETHDHARTDEILHGESAWRDIKVYADHAFVVSDLNEEHGMQIFDLTQLRNFDGTTFQTFEQTARYTGIGSAHNIVINEETGFGYIVGISSGSKTCFGGGLHVLNLKNPANPEYVGCFDNDGYTHDAQCVIYDGSDDDYLGMEICFNSNEDTFTIVNTEDKSNMQMISRTSYTDAGYTHQGWLSEDHNYFFMNDEFDESNHGYNPRTIVWDVRDLDNPIHIGDFYNEALSIDHNLYTHNNMIFESNYSSGLRVLNYERVADTLLREVAFFDTEPAQDIVDYVGSWSNYPYFESGNIIVSDMSNGLFVLKLDINDAITSHPSNAKGCEGSIQTLSVEAVGTSLTYQWQIQDGTTFIDLVDNDAISGAQTSSLEIALVEGAVRAKIINENRSIFYSYPGKLNFLDPPITDFTIDQEGSIFYFTNTSQNADSFLWDFGDGSTSTEENPTHEYTFGGSYTISLSATDECTTRTSTSEIMLPLGVEELEISIYPNPSTSEVYIDLNHDTMYQLYDLSGKMMTEGIISKKSNSIQVSGFKGGVYLLHFEVNGQKISRKISVK